MTAYPRDAMTPPEIEPDDATVEQEEAAPGLQCIPVTVEGPVRVVQLPAKASAARRVTVTTTTPVKLLGRDPRRKAAHLQVFDAAGATHGVFHGTTETELLPGDGATVPPFAARLAPVSVGGATPVASPILTLTGIDEVWVVADTAACEVSVWPEQWAD